MPKVLSADASGETRVITAYVALASTNDYEPALKRMTHGRGTFGLAVDHYDFAAPQVQDRIAREYRPIADDD